MESIYEAHDLIIRSGAGNTSAQERPPVFKVVGLVLAIASGLFIGTSFVLKKVGLLRANEKYNEEAGEGYGYLKNFYWWGGMVLMIVGEICNFVAYAFVDAILVTPLGALSVVVTTILSAIFLKERLSFVGKVGCFNCIIGSVVIVLNAPEQSAVTDIQAMQRFVISPGFLSYAGVIILGCTFIALWAGPRYGKKSMLVYLSICSLIGGLSVVATQGLGSAVIAQAQGKPQFNQWFLYVLLVFVIATLLTEIIYLNKALNLFNAALVTPTYYVFFTSATIITSAILFRGFKGTPITIVTVVMGFFQICAGVILLQLSKSSKDVPDAAVFNGDLDQIRQVGEQEQPETDPKADAIRGTAALVRRFSSARQKMEQREFERLHQEKMQDHLESVGENEIVEWDGLRRRKTIIGDGGPHPIVRRKTLHPPLGMSKFPDVEPDEATGHDEESGGIFNNMRNRASTMFSFQRQSPRPESTIRAVPMTEIVVGASETDGTTATDVADQKEASSHTFGLPAALRRKSGSRPLWSPRSKPLPPDPQLTPQSNMLSPPNSARRQWSFSNFIGRNRSPSNVDSTDDLPPPASRGGLASQGSSYIHEKKALVNATEEERLGLVKGDSCPKFPIFHTEYLPKYPDPIPTHSHPQPHPESKPDPLNPLHSEKLATEGGQSYTSSHPNQDYSAATDSDSGDDYQMINRPDSDILSPQTMKVIASAAERAKSTATTTRNLTASVPTPSNSEPPRIQQRKRPSPPPTYRQAQEEAMSDIQSPPSARVEDWPLPRSIVEPEQHPENRIQDLDLPQVQEVTSQAQRGRVLERGSVQIVQVSDRSRSSSMSRNRTRTRGESSNRAGVTPIRGEKSTNRSRSDEQPQQKKTATGRPLTLYEGEGYGSPVPPLPHPRQSPEISDTNFEETRGRYQAQSRRERDKRRMRMSMAGNNTANDGV